MFTILQWAADHPKRWHDVGGDEMSKRAVTSGAIVANHILARALTNSKTVISLTSSARLPTSALPNAVNQLTRLGQNDPDARGLAAYLRSNSQ
jgi:hypothetical protein